jgi:hypothetical protein
MNLQPSKPDVLHGISLKCLDLFLSDLKEATFPVATFEWASPWDSQWNQLFSSFVLKHFNHAYHQGALVNFPINPTHHTPANATAVLKRWFLGKQIDIEKNKYSPDVIAKKAYQVKKSKWRKQVCQIQIQVLFLILN